MENTNRFKKVGQFRTLSGSILSPHNAGLRLILSASNMAGTTKSELFDLFDKKWVKVKQDARGWFVTRTGAYKLGAINTTAVQSDTWIVHMLCQDEQLKTSSKAVVDCLKKVTEMAKYEKASVHVPSMLEDVVPELKQLLNEHVIENGVNVYYYE